MKKIIGFFHDVIYAGTEELHDGKRGICIGVNKMCLFICIINITVGPVFYFVTEKVAILVGSLLEAAFVAGIIRLNYLKKYDAANFGFYLILNLATFYFSCILGESVEAQLMIVFLIGLVIFMFDKIPTRIICILLTIGIFILLELNFKYEFIKPVEAKESAREFMRWAAYVVIISLVILIFFLYAKNNKILLSKLEDYTKQVEQDLVNEVKVSNEKSIFIGDAAHEIQSSLYPVMSFSNFLKNKVQNAERSEVLDWKQMINHLVAGCHNLKYVTSHLLENSKLEAGKDEVDMKPVNIRLLLGNIIEINKFIAENRKIQVDFSVSDKIPELLWCDPIKVVQIFTNLLNNALKFSRSESKVTIMVEKENNNWTLVVTDSGNGIRNENIERIFEPYITEKSTQNPGGIGLGLSITKKIVDFLGGNITVTSTEGLGTCFKVFLPFKLSSENTKQQERTY